MEINPSSRFRPISPLERRPTPPATQAATDAGEFSSTEGLQRALNATPDVRPEAVARGKALIESPHYPPDQTLQSLARLLALDFSTSQPTASNPPADS
jgi:hypothetical protein